MLQLITQFNPNLSQCDKLGRTALHHAVLANNETAVSYLLQLNLQVQQQYNQMLFDVNCLTIGWMTPLMMAVEQGNQNMVVALLNAGANPMLQNYLGRTAE